MFTLSPVVRVPPQSTAVLATCGHIWSSSLSRQDLSGIYTIYFNGKLVSQKKTFDTVTPYGRSLSHNLWFEKIAHLFMFPGSWITTLTLWHLTISHEYPCYQDIDRTIFICFILSRLHQCKIYVMGLLYPFSGCVILYYNSFSGPDTAVPTIWKGRF